MGRHKENCQVFTPSDIVKNMLDICGYTTNLYGQRILENSCGTGNFLMEIVRRYIVDGLDNGLDSDTIRSGLQNDIYGFEIDKQVAKECKANLRKIAKKYGITRVRWRVHTRDFLKNKPNQLFSYIVGNPPYITYAALSQENREFIKSHFSVCQEGKPDYYYAFIQASINHLAADGQLVYVVPNNFFKTWFAQRLRGLLLPGISDVYDYHHIKLFNGALTSSAIIRYSNNNNDTMVQYKNMATNRIISVDKQHLTTRWIFEQVHHVERQEMILFSNRFSAGSAIATLCNDAFLVERTDDFQLSDLIERELVRPAASPKSLAGKKMMEILFPYYYTEAGLQRYTMEEFEEKFPQAVSFLEAHLSELNLRKSDARAKWFEYGRSQALAHLNQRKLLISTLITDSVKIYELDAQTIPYSGIYIIPNSEHTIVEAKEILASQSFFEYVRQVGIPVNGNTVRISIQDVNQYVIR